MNDENIVAECSVTTVPIEAEAETLWYEVELDVVERRLDQWLTRKLPELTRSRIKILAEQGWLTDAEGHAILKMSAAPLAGQRYGLTLPPAEPVDVIPENIPLDILFEDDDILVINKPAGLVVHPAAGHSHNTLVNALLFHCPTIKSVGCEARPGIVHRLDKDTSGVMIIAKTEQAYAALTTTFSEHALTKIYTAITHGLPHPRQGRIENLIGRSTSNRQKMAIVESGGRNAITNYLVEAVLPNNLARVNCHIETGRTHQIRVHLASLLTPIVGDLLYGKSVLDHRLPLPPTRQLLHAKSLELPHPVTHETLSFTAPYPIEFLPYL